MGIKDSQTLKQLQSRKHVLDVDIGQLEQTQKEGQQRISQMKAKLNNINQEIAKLTSGDPIVSEHAIIRYLERVMGLELENIKNEILTDVVKAQINALGSGKYPIIDGHTAVVKDKTVVSIT